VGKILVSDNSARGSATPGLRRNLEEETMDSQRITLDAKVAGRTSARSRLIPAAGGPKKKSKVNLLKGA